jgi:predicted neuraminidase
MKHLNYCLLLGYLWIMLPIAAQTEKTMTSANIVTNPAQQDRYAVQNRKFTGIPSLAIANNGRMWATWYAGTTPGEDSNNYVVLATSNDDGNTWTEALVADPDGDGPVRAFDPQVWIDPDNKLWLFWAQAIGHDGTTSGVWTIKTNEPEKQDAVWTKPQLWAKGVMMDKPTVLSNGDWLFPVSTWRSYDESAKAVISKDHGKTNSIRGACNVPKEEREFDEHIVVERKDGSLWMLIRTTYGIGESVSKDRGKTWSLLKPSNIRHTSSRFFISRLASGNLLLVKHGPIGVATERTHLMAFISQDDGVSWSKGLLLDERVEISYPDGQQTKDGRIHIIYDYNRETDQCILATSFTEEDVLSADYDAKIVEIFNNRKLVSKGATN